MKLPNKPGPKLIRASIALVWLYQGLWCKLLGGVPRHAAVIAAVPFLGPAAASTVLIALGLAECGIAVWVLTGLGMRPAALAQTMLLVAMNAGGTIWAWRLIPDPGGMLVQNFAFLVLIWIATEDRQDVAQAQGRLDALAKWSVPCPAEHGNLRPDLRRLRHRTQCV